MNGHIIVDNHQDEALLTHTMRFAGLKITAFHSLTEAQTHWNESPADLVLVCLRLADPVGLIREMRRGLIGPLILIVDAVSEDTHVAMVEGRRRLGRPAPIQPTAVDCLHKGTAEAIKWNSP